MSKKILWSVIIVLFSALFCANITGFVLAEENEILERGETGTGEDLLRFDPEVEPEIIPVISGQNFIEINKKSLFDASDSSLAINETEAIYIWNFGDGTPEQVGKEIVHDFQETGSYIVTLKVKQEEEEEQVQKTIFVYNKKAVLITDSAFVKSDSDIEIDSQAGQQNLAIADQAVSASDCR